MNDLFLLFTDETNTVADSDRGSVFFVYGGLIIPSEKLIYLHEGIELIRIKYNFKREDSLKFDTNKRPRHITPEDFSKAKFEVVDLCIVSGCKFIAYVVHHGIAKSQPLVKHLLWGADAVCEKFNKFLLELNSNGIVMIDRISNKGEYNYLVKKFSTGLMYSEEKSVALDRIIVYSSTCNNASHASSAMDIVLGAFRYCLNSGKNSETEKVIMKSLVKLIWGDITEAGDLAPLEKGLILRPMDVYVPKYRTEYDSILKRFNSFLE